MLAVVVELLVEILPFTVYSSLALVLAAVGANAELGAYHQFLAGNTLPAGWLGYMGAVALFAAYYAFGRLREEGVPSVSLGQ